MTTYYTATGNPVVLTRGTSSLIRSEFTLIAAGFTSVNSEMVTKAASTGQTWTGTHDFTDATITVPTIAYGSTGSYAVSMDTLNAAVFAATLPAVPSGALPYKLSAVSGVIGWALDTLPFLDNTALAQAHAITLSF